MPDDLRQQPEREDQERGCARTAVDRTLISIDRSVETTKRERSDPSVVVVPIRSRPRPPSARSDAPPHPLVVVLVVAELKKSLHAVFSQFGKIIDVVAVKTYKLRGQAWVVFQDVASATAAMRAVQGFPFFDKPMKLAYAKAKSDATAKLDGTYDPSARDPEARAKRKAASQAEEKASQAAKAEAEARGGGSAPILTDPSAPPNEILFVQGLPGACFRFRLSVATLLCSISSARRREVRGWLERPSLRPRPVIDLRQHR